MAMAIRMLEFEYQEEKKRGEEVEEKKGTENLERDKRQEGEWTEAERKRAEKDSNHRMKGVLMIQYSY